MSTSISGLSGNNLLGSIESILTSSLQSANQTGNAVGADNAGGVAAASGSTSDNSQLSGFAKLLTTLQQLQKSDPAKYAQVTQQIATNLQSAAKTAQANGNTAAANQLNQLASDFADASKTGDLPNIQDLAKAIGGHHHHHHRAEPASTDSTSQDADVQSITSSASSAGGASNSGSASQLLQQAIASFRNSSSSNASLDPLAIIGATLASAGVTTSGN